MKLFHYRGTHPNFGDELNLWLWPRLLPDFFDEDERTVFIGIGSTLGDAPKAATKKIVFGAGFVPEYHDQPDLHDGTWQIYFVRGPRTTTRFSLSPDLAISDSAILLRTQIDLNKKTAETISFMPHWESMERGNWGKVCKRADITLIDPRLPVEEVIAVLMRSKLVIAEAMHGAIIADAFRIPWVPIMPLNAVHRGKWFDWSESLSIALKSHHLWPSALAELSKASLAQQSQSQENKEPQHRSLLSRMKQLVSASPLAPFINNLLIVLAAQRLRQLAKDPGQLSGDAALDSAIQRMLVKLEQLKCDYAK